MEETEKKSNISLSYHILLNVVTILFLVLSVIGVLSTIFTHSIWELYFNGNRVDGTVVGYDVVHTAGSSTYNLILYCSYADENGVNYNTDTQFSKMKPPNVLENLGKEQIGKKVELIVGDGTWCVARRDMEWKFAVYCVLFNIVFPVMGATIVIIRIIFEKRKSKRDKTEQVI